MAFTPLKPNKDYCVRVRLTFQGNYLGSHQAIARLINGEPRLALNWQAKYLNAEFSPRYTLEIQPDDLRDTESEQFDYDYVPDLEWPDVAGPPPSPSAEGPVG